MTADCRISSFVPFNWRRKVQDLICRADHTDLYVAFAVSGLVALVSTALFLKNLERIRAALKSKRFHKSTVHA